MLQEEYNINFIKKLLDKQKNSRRNSEFKENIIKP